MATTSGRALGLYRRLLRSAEAAFKQDAPALAAAKMKIRSEFVQPREDIEEALTLGEEVNIVLQENVIQAQELEPNYYRLNVRDTTHFPDNASPSAV
eukprot:m.206108 g.206108  ORF g.206108 m.206108 type:complete len:97 (-) comp15019_c3_seq2:2727-3017(-)